MTDGKSETTTGCADDEIMTLERWYVLERLRLDEFMAFWKNGHHGEDADGTPAAAFPLEQPAGEWDEQFRFWGD